MEITAALVKELRERTGAGMMECKKALVENQGDIETAIAAMRKSGQAKAAKRAGRIAAEGLIVIQQNGSRAAMVEVNCETDFVAKGDDFKKFCTTLVESILDTRPINLSALMVMPFFAGKTGGISVEEARQELIAKVGENINVRRYVLMNAHDATSCLGVYLHSNSRIGVIVDMRGGTPELAKNVAIHIAASRPICIKPEEVPAELLAKEREIYAAQAATSGKPANVIDKMVEGRVQKFLSEVTLLGQPFVKKPEQSIGQLLQTGQGNVACFERFEVGEGLEKKADNFAEEVLKQVQGRSAE
ncbi:MAG: translation elongation factor Ts [Beggiatoa sp. IS2]|nr:MAG: translation elongation factor Ts [Beggiatoa sp. IS2]